MSNNLEALKRGEMICRNTQFCKGMDVGIHNRLYGGIMMAEIDSTCAVFAAEVCDTAWIVTKFVNMEFVSPILPNQIFKLYVGITKIGKTSITIKAEIRKHSVHTENETVALKAEAIFVRINEEGEAIMISDTIRKKFGYPTLN